MKRDKRLTRRERKAVEAREAPTGHAAHIHCVACGRHIDPSEFTQAPTSARYLRCQHGSRYASCTGCVTQAMGLLSEHDRTGQPVRVADAWH